MSPDPSRAALRRGLRLAFAVTVGLTLEATRGAMLPFLAPVIALQLLVASPVPPPAKIVAALLAVGAGAGLLAWAVATLTLSIPGSYTIGVALLYLWGFSLCFVPALGPIGTLFITIVIAVTAMAAASTGAALGFVVELVLAVLLGIALTIVAHVVFPNPEGFTPPPPSEAAVEALPLPIHTRAALATIIMLPLHMYLTSDGVAAMVILITTATILRQPGIAQSRRYAMAFALGNMLGGVLAVISALLYALHGELPLLIALAAATSLYLATRLIAAERWAPVFVPGFVAYVVLFGMTLSSLPLGTDVAVVQRVVQIVGAALYAFAAISLLVPFLRPRLSAPGAPGP